MKTISEVQTELQAIKDKRKAAIARFTNLRADQVNIISDDFVSLKCASLLDLKCALAGYTPHKNGWKVANHYVTSLYLVKICNGFMSRELRIEIENVGGKVWFSVDIDALPKDFVSRFMAETRRPLYSTEQVYVNIPAHYKKFREIRVKAYTFGSNVVKWYGGDETLICEDSIESIISAIKEV